MAHLPLQPVDQGFSGGKPEILSSRRHFVDCGAGAAVWKLASIHGRLGRWAHGLSHPLYQPSKQDLGAGGALLGLQRLDAGAEFKNAKVADAVCVVFNAGPVRWRGAVRLRILVHE